MIPRLLVAVLALVLSACTSQAGGPSTTAAAPSSTTSEATQPSSSTTSSAESTTSVTEAALPAGTEDLPPEMREELAELIIVTQEIRGLEFLEPPSITVVSPEEMSDRIQESLLEETEDVPADQALLVLLGLLEPDRDLLQLYVDLYGEQVRGFYELETKELVVRVTDAGFSALDRATIVHELTHALTDQRFGHGDTYTALVDDQDFDRSVALLSVVEGDATLTEILYIQGLPLADQQELLAETFGTEAGAFDTAPEYLKNSLIFPYTQGLSFVQRLYGLGGFDEVNRAYVEPPTSSEQIIDPRDYQTDEPLVVRTFEPSLAGYEIAFRSVWGELGFDLMFDQILGGDDAAASGWGGDEYIQWFDGTEAALLLDVTSETAEDAAELEAALVRYAQAGMAVGEPTESGIGRVLMDEDYAFVARVDDRVVFIAAGDPAVGQQIADAIPGL